MVGLKVQNEGVVKRGFLLLAFCKEVVDVLLVIFGFGVAEETLLPSLGVFLTFFVLQVTYFLNAVTSDNQPAVR